MSQDSQHSADDFINGFFDPKSNIAWRNRDPDSPQSREIAPELELLRNWHATRSPAMLPRRRESTDPLTAYVFTHDPAEATTVGDMLTAFVGPTYSDFNGLPAWLDPDDCVDRAILDFIGKEVTFKIVFPANEQVRSAGWRALRLFLQAVRKRPQRSLQFGKPIGRLLREFDVALAAGEATASADLLDQIDAIGGLSAANLAHMRIKRLARLGRDAELLGRVPGLTDIVLSGPPVPVRDAILAAIFTTVLAVPLGEGDLSRAKQGLLSPTTWALIPGLLQGGISRLSGEALATIVVAASMFNNSGLLRAVLDDPLTRGLLDQVAPVLAELAPVHPGERGGVQPPTDTEVESGTPEVHSWLELTRLVAIGDSVAEQILDGEAWREWGPPVGEDREIAELLAGLEDEAADRAWAITGPFIDANGYDMPAAQTARALLTIALYNDHFGPGDLAGIIALTEIVLSSGPAERDFEDLLDELAAESARWVSPARASVVLDLADLLVRSGREANPAQLRLAQSLLSPLYVRMRRLEPDQVRLARQLSDELGIGLEWRQQEPDEQEEAPPRGVPPARVLLYSLNEDVLKRVKGMLEQEVPGVDVRLNHEKDGSPSMRQQARGADIIVLATQCAKHAATGFIRQNAADGCLIAEADGSGSASLLRAAVAALRERVGV